VRLFEEFRMGSHVMAASGMGRNGVQIGGTFYVVRLIRLVNSLITNNRSLCIARNPFSSEIVSLAARTK